MDKKVLVALLTEKEKEIFSKRAKEQGLTLEEYLERAAHLMYFLTAWAENKGCKD